MQELLDLALDRPDEARRRADELLASSADPLTRSYALQTIGIVLRDEGHPEDALPMLRRALTAASGSDDPGRRPDVLATLGVTLALAGRTHDGLSALDEAVRDVPRMGRARIRMRQAAVLSMLGRSSEAVVVLAEVLADLQAERQGTAWVARAHLWRAHALMRLGRISAAERDLIAASALLKRDGAVVDRLSALGNLADAAVMRGDLVSALRRYAEAIDGYRLAHWPLRFDAVCNFASAYLAAGLPDAAVELLMQTNLVMPALDEAEFRLVQASALLANHETDAAVELARSAEVMFRRQGRPWFERRARLVGARARWEGGNRGGGGQAIRAIGIELAKEGADEAPLALTLAGRLSKGDQRLELWRQAASYRNHPNALVRASAWLARALEREGAGDSAVALRACRAGLDAIDEQRRLLGSSELRAQATTHGRELTEVALRVAAAEPRRLLRWTERTRATTLAQPRMTSDAATIPESLAALRDNGRQLAGARAAGEPTERRERERLRLERAVRADSHTVSATRTDPDRPASVEDIVAGVGDGCLVEVVEVDGVLHVLVVHDGKVRRRVTGGAAEAAALLDPIAMLLRRSARGRPASTAELGRRLQEAILGDAVRLIPDGPLVLAPTTRLHGLPWSVLPVLTDRAFSVVPSAGQWLRARAVPRPADRRTVLVSGPGLESGGAEVPLLAAQHPSAQLLAGKQATLESVLAGIDGADLVHLAAHGHFRADSPLFSSLDLADGPLTVHDVERIGRAPYRVVLSACESGVLAPVGAQELLGLAAALFGLGTAGLVCSVAEVNDAATADLMVGLHASLAAGEDPATALWRVRQQTGGDGVAAGTASAFVALGT